MQFVEVELDAGESAVAEGGLDDVHDAWNPDGDGVRGRQSVNKKPASWVRLLGAGKRLLTGESLFMTVFMKRRRGQAAGGFRGAVPRKDRPHGPEADRRRTRLPEGFISCAARGVSIGIAFEADGVGLFGGEGFIMQRLQGDGSASCTPEEPCTESSRRDRRCAWTRAASWRSSPVELRHSVRRKDQDGAVRRGRLFFATLTGPGRVWLQSLPFSRMADRIYKAAPAAGGKAAKAARSLEAWATCWTEITMSAQNYANHVHRPVDWVGTLLVSVVALVALVWAALKASSLQSWALVVLALAVVMAVMLARAFALRLQNRMTASRCRCGCRSSGGTVGLGASRCLTSWPCGLHRMRSCHRSWTARPPNTSRQTRSSEP